MEKFEFLIGSWDLEYKVPKSKFSKADKGSGEGTFKRALDNKYVIFDYACYLSSSQGSAHGIFVRDEKNDMYKYWWFESSGNYNSATCNFVSNGILFLNWHDSLFIQTFKKINKDKIELRMEHPNEEGKHELVLEVIFTRK